MTRKSLKWALVQCFLGVTHPCVWAQGTLAHSPVLPSVPQFPHFILHQPICSVGVLIIIVNMLYVWAELSRDPKALSRLIF